MKKFAKIIVVIALTLSGGSLSSVAQTAAEVEASNKKMLATSSPCNQGPEAFKDFIAQFSTDRDFMDSRMKLTPAQREEYASILNPEEFTAKAPFAKDGDEWYQAWGELQFAKAYLMCGWVDSYVEYIFEFTRDNGKWYLSNIVAEE